MLGALEARLELERLEEQLDGALRAQVAARRRSRRRATARRGTLAARRQVDVGDLEQRDVLVADVDVVARGADQAVEERRPQHALERRERLGQLERVRVGIARPGASRCRPRRTRRRPGPPRRRGAAAGRWVSRPNMTVRSGRVGGTSSSSKRTTSSTTSISRRTSRARQVGTVTPVAVDVEAEALEPHPLRAPAGSAARRPLAARPGRSSIVARSGRPAWTSVWPTQRPPASSTISSVAQRAACSATYGSTPFSQRLSPSVRRCRRSALCETPTGSKFAASSSTTAVSSATSVSSPPMIPARATARSASAITRSRCVQPAEHAVERAQLLAGGRAADDDPARRRAS